MISTMISTMKKLVSTGKIIEISEPYDIKIRPIVGGSKCPNRKQSQLINILLKVFLMHIKRFIWFFY